MRKNVLLGNTGSSIYSNLVYTYLGVLSGNKKPGEKEGGEEVMTTVKKDRIFVIVLGLILVNLILFIGATAGALLSMPTSTWLWAILTANIVATLGVLVLLKAYRRGRRIEKEAQTEETNSRD